MPFPAYSCREVKATVSESTELSRSAHPIPRASDGSLLPSSEPSAVHQPAALTAPKVRKPRPKRVKAPKDSKIYKAVLAYIALKAQGLKGPDIAEQLGLEASTMKQYVYYANKKGWLNIETFADPEDRVDIVLKSKAVQNINVLLGETVTGEDGETRLSPRAGEVTLEVAKGTGLLKNHQVVKSDSTSQSSMTLRVQVETPVVGGQPLVQQVRPGSIGGMPVYDAEILGSTE